MSGRHCGDLPGHKRTCFTSGRAQHRERGCKTAFCWREVVQKPLQAVVARNRDAGVRHHRSVLLCKPAPPPGAPIPVMVLLFPGDLQQEAGQSFSRFLLQSLPHPSCHHTSPILVASDSMRSHRASAAPYFCSGPHCVLQPPSPWCCGDEFKVPEAVNAIRRLTFHHHLPPPHPDRLALPPSSWPSLSPGPDDTTGGFTSGSLLGSDHSLQTPSGAADASGMQSGRRSLDGPLPLPIFPPPI